MLVRCRWWIQLCVLCRHVPEGLHGHARSQGCQHPPIVVVPCKLSTGARLSAALSCSHLGQACLCVCDGWHQCLMVQRGSAQWAVIGSQCGKGSGRAPTSHQHWLQLAAVWQGRSSAQTFYLTITSTKAGCMYSVQQQSKPRGDASCVPAAAADSSSECTIASLQSILVTHE